MYLSFQVLRGNIRTLTPAGRKLARNCAGVASGHSGFGQGISPVDTVPGKPAIHIATAVLLVSTEHGLISRMKWLSEVLSNGLQLLQAAGARAALSVVFHYLGCGM